jgi:putative peptide zinc metalloprotease protein
MGREALLRQGRLELLRGGAGVHRRRLRAQPALRPSFEDYMFLPNPLVAILVLYAFAVGIMALHEGWHWLAARAEGVPARFRISYRGVFLVAETDLSLLLTVPRRRRFGPMLAGPALDVTVLAVALGLRWAYFDAGAPVGDTAARLLGALVLVTTSNLVWQCAVFARTDLYAVLACALSCENLYRVSWLVLKERLLPLRAGEVEELRTASSRDRSAGSWFSLLYLAGMVGMLAFLLYILLPSAAGFIYWMIKNIASVSFRQPAFWESVAVAALTAAGLLAPIPIAVRERRLRRRGALS